MGAATNILTDKTGTLTENKMKVTAAYLFDQEFNKVEDIKLNPDQMKILSKAICRNSTAFYKVVDGKQEISGSRTEGAMIDLITSLGEDIYHYRDPEQELLKFAFTSESKKMTTVYNKYDQGFEVYTKGASEVMIDICSYYMTGNGQIRILDQEAKNQFLGQIENLSCQKMRVLGLAYRVSEINLPANASQDQLEDGLILIGFIGMQDRLRQEAKESVLGVQKAGVVVRMVTGDNIDTAANVAVACGILPSGLTQTEIQQYVMTGKDFREQSKGLNAIRNEQGVIIEFELNDKDQFAHIIKNLRVIARCTPEDKLLLTIGLKELGEVVAVTGDGSNDAAALKQSDIGVAMMSGTQLAKESSDIILLDDNFLSILNAVKWGRNVYASTRKFLQFQMTVNIVALFTSILGGITVSDSPINAVQMLWVNLIMDSLAALALATEPPSEYLLESQPFGRTENIITPDMVIIIASQCVYQSTILIIILFLGPQIFGIEESWGHDDWTENNGKHFTLFFHCFVMLQIFNEINCRKVSLSQVNVFSNFFNNWMFQFILVTTFLVQICIVQFGGKYVRCSKLSLNEHLICLAVGVSALVVGVVVRVAVATYRFKGFKSSKKREEYAEESGLLGGEVDNAFKA